VQCYTTITTLGIDIGTLVDEWLENLCVAITGRLDKRSVTIVILDSDIGTLVEEQLDDFCVVITGRRK